MSNLVAYALVTLNEVKEALQISGSDDDARLSGYINRATDMIETYCGHRFLRATYTDEVYSGNNGYRLPLRNWPVVSISSISNRTGDFNNPSWTTVDSGNYTLVTEGGKDRGLVYSAIGWPSSSGNFKITYIAGYATTADIPGDIKEACIELVSFLYARAKATPGMKSETLGRYSYTLETPTSGKGGIIERLGLDSILDAYRNMVV